MATPYVISSDLVSAYPAKSLEIAQYIDGFKADLALVQNAQTGTTYTLAAADFTKLVTLSNASPVAVTLPLEATVPWPAGTQLRLLNQGAGLVTVAGAVGVTINGTPLTLAQYKGAVLTKTGTNTWTFIPFSGGSAAAVVSSTTGSPTITTDGAATVYKYTGDGTIVVGTAGLVTLLVVAGGGGGGTGAGSGTRGGGSGGAGGLVPIASFWLSAATHTVKVGAGGAGGTGGFATNGSPGVLSGIASVTAIGGGFGGSGAGVAGGGGGSGGGGCAGGAGGAASATALAQGNPGGGSNTADDSPGGGGGGAGGAGVLGGAGGAGLANSITGSSVTYAAGAAQGTTVGSANTGNGGSGCAGGSTSAFAGGSGVVIVRVG
jgi:hypothetical protein